MWNFALRCAAAKRAVSKSVIVRAVACAQIRTKATASPVQNEQGRSADLRGAPVLIKGLDE